MTIYNNLTLNWCPRFTNPFNSKTEPSPQLSVEMLAKNLPPQGTVQPTISRTWTPLAEDKSGQAPKDRPPIENESKKCRSVSLKTIAFIGGLLFAVAGAFVLSRSFSSPAISLTGSSPDPLQPPQSTTSPEQDLLKIQLETSLYADAFHTVKQLPLLDQKEAYRTLFSALVEEGYHSLAFQSLIKLPSYTLQDEISREILHPYFTECSIEEGLTMADMLRYPEKGKAFEVLYARLIAEGQLEKALEIEHNVPPNGRSDQIHMQLYNKFLDRFETEGAVRALISIPIQNRDQAIMQLLDAHLDRFDIQGALKALNLLHIYNRVNEDRFIECFSYILDHVDEHESTEVKNSLIEFANTSSPPFPKDCPRLLQQKFLFLQDAESASRICFLDENTAIVKRRAYEQLRKLDFDGAMQILLNRTADCHGTERFYNLIGEIYSAKYSVGYCAQDGDRLNFRSGKPYCPGENKIAPIVRYSQLRYQLDQIDLTPFPQPLYLMNRQDHIKKMEGVLQELQEDHSLHILKLIYEMEVEPYKEKETLPALPAPSTMA